MKTNKIKQWAALLLTFSGMAALPLATSARNINTDVSGTPDNGTTYNNESLNIYSNGAYIGNGITVSNTETLVYVDGGKVTLNNGNFIRSGFNQTGLYVLNSGTLLVNNSVYTASGNPIGGFRVQGTNSIGVWTGGTISIENYLGNGAFSVGIGASGTLSDAVINVSGAGYGVYVDGAGTVDMQRVTINTASGRGVHVSGTGSVLRATDVNVNSASGEAIYVIRGAYAEVTRYNFTTTGNQSGIVIHGSGTLIMNDSNITTQGSAIVGDIDASDGRSITINGGTFNSSHLVWVLAAGNGLTEIILNNVDASNAGGISTSTLNTANTITNITVNGGSGIHGDVTTGGNGSLNINLNDSSLTGNVITGTVSVVTVNSDHSTLTGNVSSGDGSNLTVNLTNSSTMAGDLNTSGTGAVTLNMDSHTRYDGNISHGGGALSLNLSADSHGKGNWQHGNLNLDNTSSWTFTGSSVIDNLNNDGKLIFDINSDDQTYDSVNVTGTASGTGRIHVNVTGTSKAKQEDQDRIFGDIVQGNGKGVWEFDPVEWGLEEEDVIVVPPTPEDPNGSVYVRPNGKLSTAGNIATGLLAAQKGSWFAQQNSLLKRMGEIRLLNDAYTQTLAGKDDKFVTLSADKLIENVWIRAYGQQLNYGASVTGQAFKQYVYGTDIGTDHKFTLDNNNALYAGIFASYGAADTDHRHNGSKSEISNYYAGLYASWLNVDGWYLDATLKAQYTNNSLDGYTNGIEYFNGSYNNWSVGGSIELGKQFKFQDDWFIEPQFQANYVHILASDYTLSQGLNINVSDLDAFQLRLGVVAGRTLKLKNGGALQPYVKLSGVEMLSTGGKLNAMGNTVRPNLDGARAELGAGIIWQLDAHNQLHLDYEASFGDKYDKPWGLTAGYRYQF